MNNNFFQQAKQIGKSVVMIISWTLFALLILIIGFLVYYLVCTNIYASRGESYEPFFSLYTIVSPSMEPNINVYDVILNVKIKESQDIKVGDVITFISTSNISDGMTVTHRVTSIIQGPNGPEYKTKGDNNISEDTDTAKYNNVLGKVVLKIPQLGRIQFFLSSNGGWLIVVIIPALYIIINDILKISRLNKAKKAIIDLENGDNNDEKIKLEAFRKEEIKAKLQEKEMAKAKKLEENMKKGASNSKKKIANPSKNQEQSTVVAKNNVDDLLNSAVENYEIKKETPQENKPVSESKIDDKNPKMDIELPKLKSKE